jgi:polyhydroxybutyrate depolymerase
VPERKGLDMTLRMVTWAVFTTALTLAVPGASAETMTWKVAGETRSALVYAPSASSPTGKAPLVFSFHGRGDDMENFQLTEMHKAWPEAIVVYFQGLPNPNGLYGWQVEKGQDDDRDLKLVDAALASLRSTFKVDDARIYATGFSNGASFTYLLWAERPGTFAAYAPVAGRLRPSVQLKQPKPVFHVAGRRDPQVLFSDQQQAIQAAIRVDGVADTRAACGQECTIYGAGSAAPVMTWIHQGGHIYPRDTSERIAKFFREHPARP